MERALIGEYEALLDELLAGLRADTLDAAVALARLPETIRGYGHVKLANVAKARVQRAALLDRFHGRTVAAPVTVAMPQRVKSVAEL